MNDHTTTTPDWATALVGADSRIVTVLSGGSSRDTMLLEVPAAGTRVIVRHDRAAGPLSDTPFTLAREAATYASLGRGGLPVPAVVAVAPDGSGFAVEEVPGTPEAGADALDDYLAVLGRLHATGRLLAPAGFVGFDEHGAEDLAIWEAIARDRIRREAPIIGLAFESLRRRGAFTPGVVVLCHGDAGAGNYLHRDGVVSGLVDWEMAHTGDPHDDLASIAVRAALTRVALGDYRRRIATRYEPASGIAFDEERFRVAVAAVLTRMVVSCLATLDNAEPGTDRTIQLMGLPLMEVHLVRMLALLDGRTLPVVEAPTPDLAFAAELSTVVADGLRHHIVPRADRAAAVHARRLLFLSEQLATSLRPAGNLPTGRSDLDDAWIAATRRVAVLPSSGPIAGADIAGVR